MIIPAARLTPVGSRPLRILVLDDDPERVYSFQRHLDGADVVHVPSAAAAKYQLKNAHYDVVMLDHDLGLSKMYFDVDEPGTGMDVVEWMCRIGPSRWSDTLIIVHSLNSPCGRDMVETLRRYDFLTSRRAFAWDDISVLMRLASRWEWDMDLERWDCTFPPQRATKGPHHEE